MYLNLKFLVWKNSDQKKFFGFSMATEETIVAPAI